MTLSDLANRRGRLRAIDDPQDAVVHTAPVSSLDPVVVRLTGSRRRYTVEVAWVSNGRMPAVGDACALIATPKSGWALVDATGPVITS